MRLLKTEWEPGRDPPRGAGSKSLVNFVAEDLLRETVSSGVEGSRALSTQSGHRHLVASEELTYQFYVSSNSKIHGVGRQELTVIGFQGMIISGTLAMGCTSLG